MRVTSGSRRRSRPSRSSSSSAGGGGGAGRVARGKAAYERSGGASSQGARAARELGGGEIASGVADLVADFRLNDLPLEILVELVHGHRSVG